MDRSSQDTPARRLPRWTPRLRAPGFTFTVLFVLVLGTVILAPSLRAVMTQQQQIADLQSQIAQKNSEADDAQRSLARWDDPSYVRAQARDRLLYVMPGETSYLVIDDRPEDALPAATAPVSDQVEKTQSNWGVNLLRSFVVAGLANAQPEADAESGQGATG